VPRAKARLHAGRPRHQIASNPVSGQNGKTLSGYRTTVHAFADALDLWSTANAGSSNIVVLVEARPATANDAPMYF